MPRKEAPHCGRLAKLWESIILMKDWTPSVGDWIYVATHLYIERGEDDVVGGLAEVTEVEEKFGSTFVTVEEHPGHSYNWKFLMEEQKELMREFGRRIAYPDPDRG